MVILTQFWKILYLYRKSSRKVYLPILLFCVFSLASGMETRAEITWAISETEFDYSINNLSYFYYEQNTYYNDYNQYIIKDDTSAQYDSIAEIQFGEFEGIPLPGSGIEVQAKAMGPPNGNDPPDGLMVQSYLNTVADSLNDEQGSDIDLETVSRVVRRFVVNSKENYKVKVDLSGIADFDSFYVNSQYRAWYSIQAEVKLDQIVGTGDQMVVQDVPGFPKELDESNRIALVEVELRPADDQLQPITYRIKIELKLKSRIDNLALQNWFVAGNINGNYNLGSPQAPLTLKVLFISGTKFTNSAINLLLLSD